MRIIIFIFLLSLTIGTFGYSIYLMIYGVDVKTYCGTIQYKHTHETHHRYEHEENGYFVVKFDNGYRSNIQVEWLTYLDHKENDRVCFDMAPSSVNDGDWFVERGFGAILIILSILLGLVTASEYDNI